MYYSQLRFDSISFCFFQFFDQSPHIALIYILYQRICLIINHISMELPNNQPILPYKKSLCRFYVRGLCMLPKEACRFSHGIHDLDYQPYMEGEVVEEDYLKDTDFCQKKAVKGPRIYINLYDFQTTKKYTLEQLNNERPLRVEVRSEMHRQMFHDFIELIELKHPGANLTEEMLIREYTRVGFNKLMTRIKFSHLVSYLCDVEGSKYFKKTIIMPPCVKREVSFIFKKASEEQILEAYRQQYQKILKETEEPLEQAMIKKKLFQMINPHFGIPPLSTILKEKRLAFTDFLEVLNGNSFESMMEKIRLEAKPEEMIESACTYLNKEASTRLVGWGELYQELSRQFKINNGNILNQVKPLLVLQGYRFLYFPTAQFIYHPQFAYEFKNEKLSNCPCQYRNKYSSLELDIFQNGESESLKDGESVDINSFQSLLRYGSLVLKSKVLGVDLEGSLRRGGFVQMIQLNNQVNTFLFDIFAMQQKGDHQAIALTKKLMRNIMADEEILKIFHDCRHDSLALHLFLETCIINVFDTSASETVIMQLQNYSEITTQVDRLAKAKAALSECINIKTLGLNEILKRYNASHGINKHKERFHKMWSQGEVDFFCRRPLDPDYREYCIKDVLDLPEVYQKFKQQVAPETLQMCEWLSSSYVRQGYQNSKELEQQQ